jgi:hypothetical protein
MISYIYKRNHQRCSRTLAQTVMIVKQAKPAVKAKSTRTSLEKVVRCVVCSIPGRVSLPIVVIQVEPEQLIRIRNTG